MKRRPISDLTLEKLALGVLPPDEAARVRESLLLDADARARWEALERHDASFFSRLPSDTVQHEVERRARSHTDARARPAWLAPAFAALAACITTGAAIVLLLARPTAHDVDAGYRLKGSAQLLVSRVKDNSVQRLGAGDSGQEGDRLQLAIVPHGRRYGVVVSVDGRGHATLHFPLQDVGDARLVGEGPLTLPTSYRLDDAPSFERFLLVTADAPLDPRLVMVRAEALGRKGAQAATAPLDGLPADTEQCSVVLWKVP